ncbi:hypothetical protein ANASTE_00778 [Anaerofustis stercorihominis DSM 17244]|uniref:Uncharacterized protein n=1 Tax=Anaerofustis stercorihominis DSM 17244 TaxID=445971 RepID=B1C7S5_9FIRM|nr:DUF6323 family protein [Anaerofustis stercorihominis]EDS73062.1 hypothetical protein ANASTE_00778 [Anaerofustis stercorihominis DSM 17244]
MDNENIGLILGKITRKELDLIEKSNVNINKFGLTITREEAKEIIISKNEMLKKYKRIEFSSGVTEKIIYIFSDSAYIDRNNYIDTIKDLVDIFYNFKNETEDKLTDDELLNFMREQFDDVCYGDLGYLRDTCLERFSKAVRDESLDYIYTQGKNIYENLSEEQRWDKDLYQSIMKELFWE